MQGKESTDQGGQTISDPPPTSTNVERLFSYAGMVMEDRRALLMPERVNKILFLRENLVMLNFKLDW